MANPDARSIGDEAGLWGAPSAAACSAAGSAPCGAGSHAGEAAARSVMAASTANIPTTDNRVDTARASGLSMMMGSLG